MKKEIVFRDKPHTAFLFDMLYAETLAAYGQAASHHKRGL